MPQQWFFADTACGHHAAPRGGRLVAGHDAVCGGGGRASRVPTLRFPFAVVLFMVVGGGDDAALTTAAA